MQGNVMKIIYGLTTFNRKDYLENHLKTWYDTIDKDQEWTLYINDDGSEDGSQEYIDSLKFNDVKIVKNFAARRGVHHGINKILKYAEENPFDVGFKAEDDIFFKKDGWDNLYISAMEKSRYKHLAFTDKEWANKYTRRILLNPPRKNKAKSIEAKIANAYNAYGCFWTFTPAIIKRVGYIDVKNFGLAGNGHTDYTLRCCNLGFNNRRPFYDAINSELCIGMIRENYRCAASGKTRNFASTYGVRKGHKGKVLERKNRRYIPYAELEYNVFGEPI